MLIVCKDSENIIDFGVGCRIFVAENVVKYVSGDDWCKLGIYETKEQAKMAIKMISENQQNVFYMPSVKQVTARIISDERKHHNIAGKKTKGHGGS